MSAATIDRRLGGERKRLELKGRAGTKPGSLLKSQIKILCGHPLTGVGRFPSLAGGPAGPAMRETLHCCRRA